MLCSKSRVGITCQWPILMLYLVSILNPMKNPNHAKTDKRRNQSLDHTRLKGKYQVKTPIRKKMDKNIYQYLMINIGAKTIFICSPDIGSEVLHRVYIRKIYTSAVWIWAFRTIFLSVDCKKTNICTFNLLEQQNSLKKGRKSKKLIKPLHENVATGLNNSCKRRN